MTIVMPKQKPHRSIQEVSTPWDLIDAVEARFGKLTFDLAASKQNCKVRQTPKLHFNKSDDALCTPWPRRGNLWLNPEFGDIEPYAECCWKALHGTQTKATTFLLVPASVGSNWWAHWVDGKSSVKFLSPRVTFMGHTSPYPKDLALCVYDGKRGYECWRWKA